MKNRTLIIGAGSIGATKPDEFDSPTGTNMYTHAHACYSHPDIELVGIVDVDYVKAAKAAMKWNTQEYNSVSDFGMCGRIADIIIVCVPTEHHFQVINNILKMKHLPRLIVCEKPFTDDYDKAKEISKRCKELKVNLVINYTRSFVPELNKLSKDLREGEYGEVYNFTLRYSRGFKREASHAFHWCLNAFGSINISHTDIGHINDSPMKGDFSTFLYGVTKNCILPSISFIPIGDAYSTYNADIYTEKGRIELLNNWKTIRKHELVNSSYGAYPCTGLLFEDTETGLDRALTNLLDYCIEYLNKDIPFDENTLFIHKLLR